MATKLGAEHIESFQMLKQTDSVCAFKGCVRSGRVKLFWREEGATKQEKSYICVNHALSLANEVLSKYKFGGQE